MQGEHALNGQYSQGAGGGRLVVTGQASFIEYSEDFWLRTTAPDGSPLEREVDPYEESTRSGEVGVTYQRPVASWHMALTALATRKNYESDVIATHFDGADVQDSEFTAGAAPAQRRDHRARHVHARPLASADSRPVRNWQ